MALQAQEPPVFEHIPMRRVITNANTYAKPEQMPFSKWFANPRMLKSERAKRPKLGSNPFQPLNEQFQSAFASAGMKRTSFKPAFASTTAFRLYKKAHPKSTLRQEWRDIDQDGLKDALVYNGNGEIIGVNGMVVKDSNWRALQPYYETSAQKRLTWEKSQGFRADDDTSKVSGIAKQWKDKFLKPVYELILTKDVDDISERELEFITEIRKEYPVSKISKAFIKELMTQEAIKALQHNGFQGGDDEVESAIKSLTSTKKFKAYIFQLCMSAEKTPDYLVYLANLVRDYILNASKGQYDISRTKAWQSHGIVVKEGGEDVFRVQVPGVALPAQAQGDVDGFVAKLQQLYGLLENVRGEEAEAEVDPNMQRLATALRMPNAQNSNNGEIVAWVISVAQQLGLV